MVICNNQNQPEDLVANVEGFKLPSYEKFLKGVAELQN